MTAIQATARRTSSLGILTLTLNNATPGAVYYVGIRYQANSVLGKVVTSPYPAVPYTFTTALNDILIDTSIDSITFCP